MACEGDIDEAEVRRAAAVLADPDHWLALRGLPSGREAAAPGGDPDAVAAAAKTLANDRNVYYLLNPVPAGHKGPTSASQVVRRRWLLVDVDPARPAAHRDDMATEQEKAHAVTLAAAVLDGLRERGWPDPVEVDSGNGTHLLYRVDLPNDAEARDLLRRCLAALARLHTAPGASIDARVFDAPRLAKLPGTTARKGADTPDRPHRRCRLLSRPEPLAAVPRPLLDALAALAEGDPAPPPAAPSGPAAGPTPAYAAAAVRGELARIAGESHGNRNNVLNDAAFRLFTMAANPTFGLSPEAVEADCIAAGLAAALGEAEVRATVASARRAGLKSPRVNVRTDGPPPPRAAKPAAGQGPTAGGDDRWILEGDEGRLAEGHDLDMPDVGQGAQGGPKVFKVESLGTILHKVYPEPKYAVHGLLSEGLNILAGPPKLGKAQPLDALVMTPNGYRRMGDLAVGDEVTAADGKAARVVAVHPQGPKQVFRVSISDGFAAEATADHLWQVQSHDDRQAGRPGRVVTTEQVAASLARGERRKTYLPVCGPVEFANAGPLPVDPYLLGVILGDGSATRRTVSVSFGDAAILDHVTPTLPDGVRAVVGRSARYAYLSGGRGVLGALLRDLGVMGKRSFEKSIPDRYMTASVADRLAVLQGLLDTDGTVTLNACGTGMVVYCSTSFRMADQVAFLAQSLGGTARVSVRQTHAYRGGVRKAGRPSKTVSIRLPRELGCPFRLKTKADKWAASRTKINTQPVRSIVAVDAAGVKPCQCITIDREDGLYLTDHCVVTHNSMLSLNLALTIAGGGKALGDREVRAGDVLYLSLEDQARRVKTRAVKMLGGLPTVTREEAAKRLHVVTSWKRQDRGGLAMLDAWVRSRPAPSLVIIDVWNRYCPEVRNNSNAYSQDADSMSLVKQLADHHGITALVVHHTRKGSPGASKPDDFVAEVSGTLGLAGTADGILVMARDRGGNQAHLYHTGRDAEEGELVVEFDPTSLVWRSLGTAAQHMAGRVQQQVVEFLRARSPYGATCPEIADAIGEQQPSVRQALNRMLTARAVAKKGNLWTWPAGEDAADGL